MVKSTELAERQRRALDRLRPLADTLGLYLAGGTAIALHLNHRVSRDIDLFSREPDLDLTAVHAAMTALPGVEVVSMTDATLHVRLEGLPVDVVRYPYRQEATPASRVTRRRAGNGLTGPDVHPPEVNTVLLGEGVRCQLGIPILVQGRAIGVTWVKFTQARDTPGPTLMTLAQGFMAAAGLIVEAVRHR